MIRLSDNEYVFLVRPGSVLSGTGPGYLYIEGRVSSVALSYLTQLNKQMSDILSGHVSVSGDKNALSLWKQRLAQMTRTCSYNKLHYEKLDTVGFQLRRSRSYVVGKTYCALKLSCLYLYPDFFSEFGSTVISQNMALVFYGKIDDSFKQWFLSLSDNLSRSFAEWNGDISRYFDYVLSLMDKARILFDVDSVILPESDLDWLPGRAVSAT